MKMWKSKPLLYIAGPMTSEGNPYYNIKTAVEAAQYAKSLGWAVCIPHLDCLAAMITGPTNYSVLDNDFNLLYRCSAILILPFKVEKKDEVATGTSQEVDFAASMCIPMYSLETLPTAMEFPWAF